MLFSHLFHSFLTQSRSGFVWSTDLRLSPAMGLSFIHEEVLQLKLYQ